MTQTVAEAALQFLFNSGDSVAVTLFGGEPMLNPEICDFVLRRGIQLAKERGVDFNSDIITNATVLPEKFEEIMRELLQVMPIITQLSVDGIPDVQDMNRVRPDGAGSWSMCAPIIERWKDIYKDYPDGLNIHGCLTVDTMPFLWDSYQFFRNDLGIKNVWFLPVCEEEWEQEHIEMYRSQMELIYQDVVERMRATKSIEEAKTVSPLDRSLNPCNTVEALPCAAGVNYGSVTAKGDFYPCHQFYYSPNGEQTKLGNVFDGIDESKARLYRHYDGGDLCDVNECDHGYCFRCIAVNWTRRETILSQRQGTYCELMQIDWHYQKLLKKEIELMGITNGKNIACQMHTADITEGCDIVTNACKAHTHDEVPTQQRQEGGEKSCGHSPEQHSIVTLIKYQKKILERLDAIEIELGIKKRVSDG